MVVDVALAAVLVGMLAVAPQHPVAAWLAATAALVAGGAHGTAPGGELFATYVLVAAHAGCAGRWDGRWTSVAAIVALIAAAETCMELLGESHGGFLWIVPAGWLAGRALRDRAQLAARLAERARDLESEREAHAALSVRYERARIASELHDIVAHAISVMVVQASAGQRLAVRDPELADEAFDAIAEAARRAEQDMGRLVALLGDEHAIGSAPDLALVEELVARAAGSGLAVTLRLEGDREGLPAAVALVAFRVVQEGLTNALRYASGAAVAVLVRGDGRELVVEVSNGQPAATAELAGIGTGNGLRGLRERVDACGGTLAAGATADGGWLLSARLPRRVVAAASSA